MPSVSSITRGRSPLNDRMLRVSCDAVAGGSPPEHLWIDYPPELDPFLDASGNPWAILLLPTAVVRGEPLDIELPVDSRLLDNLHALQQAWASWYDWAQAVPINAERSGDSPSSTQRHAGRESALFFTGGVDSLFSLIRHDASDARSEAAEAPLSLVTIHGFDISLANESEFEKVESLCSEIAGMTGSSSIPLATNLRAIDGYGRSWGPLSHAAALAGIGHLFSGRFGRLIIGSTRDHDHLSPWGSHPSTDPLFSSHDVEVVHDGAEHTRVEKTRALLDRKDLVGKLRVCWKGGGADNCSRCAKCLRTMVTIDLYGEQDAVASFDWTEYGLDRVAEVYLATESYANYFQEIRDAAAVEGRNDIVEAIDRSIARSARRRRLQQPVQRMLKDLVSHRSLRPIYQRINRGGRTHR